MVTLHQRPCQADSLFAATPDAKKGNLSAALAPFLFYTPNRKLDIMMMKKKIPALAALLLFLPHPLTAQDPTFDLHVHLRNGAESIDEYEAQVTSAKRQVTAFGGMWFGGPRQALQGDVEHTRRRTTR